MQPLLYCTGDQPPVNLECHEELGCSAEDVIAPQDHTYATSTSVTHVGIQCELLKPPVETCDASVSTKLPTLVAEDIKDNDRKTRFYTGLPNWATFHLLFQLFLKHGCMKLKIWDGPKRSMDDPGSRKYQQSSAIKPGRQRTLRAIDEFFMMWLRLRHDIRQEMLGDMFNVSVKTVSRILNTWINFAYDHMKGLISWPSKENILANLPPHFSSFSNVRIILDATEIFCEKPSSLTAQSLTYSDYKSHNTMKVVIGVTPSGMVSYISRLWGGHTSDRHIIQQDGAQFMSKLQENDIVVADKGFTIVDLLPPGTYLNLPPFVSTKSQMTKRQFFKLKKIASPHIVVEMKIE